MGWMVAWCEPFGCSSSTDWKVLFAFFLTVILHHLPVRYHKRVCLSVRPFKLCFLHTCSDKSHHKARANVESCLYLPEGWICLNQAWALLGHLKTINSSRVIRCYWRSILAGNLKLCDKTYIPMGYEKVRGNKFFDVCFLAYRGVHHWCCTEGNKTLAVRFPAVS